MLRPSAPAEARRLPNFSNRRGGRFATPLELPQSTRGALRDPPRAPPIDEGGASRPPLELPQRQALRSVAATSSSYVLPFERPVVELVSRLRELRDLAQSDFGLQTELHRLEDKTRRLAREIYADLSPWQKVQLSRHPNRPYALDYIDRLFSDFVELHGDRRFGDDAAIVAGLGRFHGRSVAIVAQHKGRGTKEKIARNFGQANPEGYRKALRIYALAVRFRLPILTLIDTAGAYPGLGAEERGQSEAIGACLAQMSTAPVPIIATIIGEGGSGGALALGVANRVLVTEYRNL